MIKKVKTAVIGGGAAGISAAIAAGSKFGKGSTVIIEKQSKIGRKLLATGNGRCNIGNKNMSAKYYHGDTLLIKSVLSEFTVDKAVRFYSSIGLLLKEDSEGRLYPYSNRAETVLECFRNKLKQLSVEIICGYEIIDIRKEKGLFVISAPDVIIYARYLVFATGSEAAPYLGADSSGYNFLQKKGLQPSPLFPSLSPVICQKTYRQLKGVRAKGYVTLYGNSYCIISKYGDIQFTDTGLSGICIFDISRYVNEFFTLGTIAGHKYSQLKISVDLMPEYSENDVLDYLRKCRKIFASERTENILSAALDKKISAVLIKYSGIERQSCGKLSEDDLKKLAFSVKHFGFIPSEISAFKNAQVSAGGFDCQTVDSQTLMCRKVKNLFICGELLDIDGECGGYNLHFAIGSGMLTAKFMK